MSVVKLTNRYGEAKYYIQLEKINYVERIPSKSLLGDEHYEVIFSGDGQQRLSVTEDQAKKLIKALEQSRG